MEQKPTKGIYIEYYSKGEPGPGAYRGIDIQTGKELFLHKFTFTVSNLEAFFGIVQGVKYRKEQFLSSYIYCDNETAIFWVKNRTGYAPENFKTIKVLEHIENCNRWLVNNIKKDNEPVIKWDTANWGKFKTEKSDIEIKLKKFVEDEMAGSFPDITTLSKLNKLFNLNAVIK